MERRASNGHWDRFKMDVARWVVPQGIAPLDAIGPQVIVKLLYRHLPLRAMAWFRLGSWFKQRRVPMLPGVLQRRLLLKYGLELMVGADIGGGLYIAHPVGCVLMADSIGENVSVISAVTFGMRGEPIWPRIGDRAFVGTGARVLGAITVGADASIGANAVVITDVAPGATMVGVPAVPLARR